MLTSDHGMSRVDCALPSSLGAAMSRLWWVIFSSRCLSLSTRCVEESAFVYGGRANQQVAGAENGRRAINRVIDSGE